MDPNEALRRLRAALRRMHAETSREARTDWANDVAEYAEALDTWIAQGGFLPAEWARTAGTRAAS